MNNTILCVKWGQKYSREYVEKLKKQCEDNCSVPFNFYCLTDNPQKDYDILLPTYWDSYYHEIARGFFWAYRKCYMFRPDLISGDGKIFPDNSKFMFLDLDVIIHQDLKYFFDFLPEVILPNKVFDSCVL